MSELKKAILKEINDLVDSGMNKDEATSQVLKNYYSNYYKESIKLRSDLGLEYTPELEQYKLYNNGNNQ